MDITAWLTGLGLERYSEAFKQNEINGDLLATLTADDLRDLGVRLVGHRRIILNAIKALNKTSGPADSIPVEIEGKAADSLDLSHNPSKAERRQITVMFVDLVGSTALSADLDPEDMRDVLLRYQNSVAKEIGKLDGHLAKFMGDGVLAYFGWPKAHEDDAERAVRAALAARDVIATLTAPNGKRLGSRIGIATGLVVVGDLVGEGAAQEEAVVGETPNLAARLQAVAQPGQVIIADSTRQILRSRFELDDLGEYRLKGFQVPARIFAVVDELISKSRFEARADTLTQLVGRDQELTLLLRSWAKAQEGFGQAMLLTGEAGIGKSRLTQALLDQLQGDPHTYIRYQCSPYHQDSAFWPVIQQLGIMAGISRSEPEQLKLDKFADLLSQTSGEARQDILPLAANLFGLSLPEGGGVHDLPRHLFRARILDVLARQFAHLAKAQPVLLLLEDAHWIDPTTLELIHRTLNSIKNTRVLVLLTSRPENQPDLSSHSHLTHLHLSVLCRTDIEAIVRQLGGHQLSDTAVSSIIARADGIPLFVEELTKAVIETDGTTVPTSLHDSLMARLDRIPEVREVAQVASCIGREFDHEVLSAIVGQDRPDLSTLLDRLIESGLIAYHETRPKSGYSFKHALIRDAAYSSLLRSTRRTLHARIAVTLEQRFPEIAQGQPEIIAEHYINADDFQNAIIYLLKAGQDSIRKSANIEAIEHLNKGIKLLRNNLKSGKNRTIMFDLLTSIGPALIAVKGFASKEVGDVYTEAHKLTENYSDRSRVLPVLNGLWNFHLVGGSLHQAQQISKQSVAISKAIQDAASSAGSHHTAGVTEGLMGNFEQSKIHLEEAIGHYDPAAHRQHALMFGADFGVFGRSMLSHTLWHLGRISEALKVSARSLSLAREADHPFSLALSLDYRALLLQLCGDPTGAEACSNEAMKICEERGYPYYLAWAEVIHGWCRTAEGSPEAGANEIRFGLASFDRTGGKLRRPYYLSLLAELCGNEGKEDEGIALLDEAIELGKQTGERWREAELSRRKGSLMLKKRPTQYAEAERFFRTGIEVSHSQGAVSYEVLSATSLA